MLKTGDKVTRKPIAETVLTKPETISSLTVSEINTGKIQLRCFTIYNLQFTIRSNCFATRLDYATTPITIATL